MLQAHPKVAQRLKFLIKQWSELPEFKDDPALRYSALGSTAVIFTVCAGNGSFGQFQNLEIWG